MELHQLEYFVAVVEEGSVTRAAEKLMVAQPSISQQLKKLERESGQPLLDRLPRGVVPTEAGRRMLEHARKILAQVRDAKRHVADARQGVTGPLVVGAIPTIAPFLFPKISLEFLNAFPDVELILVEDVTHSLVERLERAEIDLALASSVDNSRRVLVEKVAAEPLRLLMPAGHRLAELDPVEWAALDQESFLVLHDLHCLAGQVQQVCAARDCKPRVVSQGAQLTTIAAMASVGLGVSIVPEMMRSADVDVSRIYRPLAGLMPARELNLLWSPDRYRTNAAREFAAIARDHMRRMAVAK